MRPVHTLYMIAIAIGGYYVPVAMGGSTSVYSAAVLIAIFAVMAYGLDIIISDLGEVSLAQPVFFAVGAYSTGLLATSYGVNSWVTLIAAVLASLASAVVLGVITLRLREFAFSLVTYSVTIVSWTVVENWNAVGASDGIRGIPPLALPLPVGPALAASSDRELWPYAYLLLIVVIYCVARFRRSRLGQSAVMAYLNPRLTIMSGINPQIVRFKIFLFSAPLTAAAGWLYAYQRSFIGPDVLDMYFFLLMFTAVALVGRRVLFGPLIGIALILIQEKFFSLGSYADKVCLGTALIISVAFIPNGLIGLWRRRGDKTALRLLARKFTPAILRPFNRP